MDTEKLTKLRDQMTYAWFSSLKIGDSVYNYSFKWQNKQIVDKKLREGIIKEIHNDGPRSHYVLVDNLVTKRENKWNDYDLVKPQEIQDIELRLERQLSETAISDSWIDSHKQNSTANEKVAQIAYQQLIGNAPELLKDRDVQQGKCSGIYGAFNKNTGECIYIGKSKSLISKRWLEHKRNWKRLRPIHRQLLLIQYLYFFGDQIEWRVLLPIRSTIDNDIIEYCERRIFEKYRPIANSIIPNGTYYGRSVLEGEGNSIHVSEWNPDMVTIKISKGSFNGFSDDGSHFEYTQVE